MVTLDDVVLAMDGWLQTGAIPDYPGAMNGLQLGSNGPVTRVACAVDACETVIDQAVDSGADLLLVHHGMFWSGARPVVGASFRKIRRAMAGGMAIYSSHIPLDVHPQLGNNIGLARAIGLDEPVPYFPWQGILLGLMGRADCLRENMAALLESAVGGRVHLCPGGPERIRQVGIITGGAGGEIATMADTGIDTFITGEGPHWSYTAAEELGLNVFYAGHYATETFGVKSLACRLEETFDLPWQFIDHPSGI